MMLSEAKTVGAAPDTQAKPIEKVSPGKVSSSERIVALDLLRGLMLH